MSKFNLNTALLLISALSLLSLILGLVIMALSGVGTPDIAKILTHIGIGGLSAVLITSIAMALVNDIKRHFNS